MRNAKDISKEINSDNSSDKLLTKALLPSVLGIVLCIIMLCGTTFAWLTDSAYAGGSKLTAGNFAVSVSVNNSTVTETQVELEHNTAYIVSVTKNGNSENGYAILTIENSQVPSTQSYLIEEFPDSVSITTADTGAFSVRVVPYWGKNKPDYTILPETIDFTLAADAIPDKMAETAPEDTACDNIDDGNGGE